MTDFLSLLSFDLPAYLGDLETLVNMDCGTHSKAGVDQVVRVLRARLREFGAEIDDFPQDKYGDMIYARWRGRGAPRFGTLPSSGTASRTSRGPA